MTVLGNVALLSLVAGLGGLIALIRKPGERVFGFVTGGSIRLFIEAEDRYKSRRIVYLDREDGYVGRDFCRGPGSVCQTLADYSARGACEPKVAIGLEGDAVEGKAKILNAFQFEVGYPTLDGWRWDAAPGTFMLFNCGAHVSAPSSATGSTCYAVWDGSEWRVQYDLSGRPEVFPLMAVPAPVHLGGARYKLYFRKGTPMTPRPPPPTDVRVIYADGRRTGNPAWVDYEDWESVYASRQVNYLWPDGTLVDDANEGTLDDFVFFMPTSDPHWQLMYTACAVPGGVEDPDGGIAIAVLVNP